MAIGRTFKEAFMKGVRSLEFGRNGLLFSGVEADRGAGTVGEGGVRDGGAEPEDDTALRKRLAVPSDRRLWDLFRAIGRGWSIEQIHEITKIDRWFLRQFADVAEMRQELQDGGLDGLDAPRLRRLKRAGFGDQEIAFALGVSESAVRDRRVAQGLRPVYKRVDTCAAEFESFTPYLYGAYEASCEAEPTAKDKVVILGSGPNRIGDRKSTRLNSSH